MAWKVEFTDAAKRDLRKIDHPTAKRILEFLATRVAQSEDPFSVGSALKGPEFHHIWRYRVGHYRILTRIDRNTITILVVEIGHRREIYR